MNFDRELLYYNMFRELIEGNCAGDEETENMRANLLVDVRWPEVAKSFSVMLLGASMDDEPIRPLADDFERLVGRAATIAFGSSRHADIPSWFLQNYEGFLAYSLHKALQHWNGESKDSVWQRKWSEHELSALFDVAKGLRSYVGLSHLSQSTGAHVLMSAVANAKYDFLNVEINQFSYGHQALADVLAQELLKDPNHALEAESAFCFFARSQRWRAFADRCVKAGPLLRDRPLARLLNRVAAVTGRKDDDAPEGLFFLASRFLDAGASPARPARIARTMLTPAKNSSRATIGKRSVPFVRLVRRLLSDAE